MRDTDPAGAIEPGDGSKLIGGKRGHAPGLAGAGASAQPPLLAMVLHHRFIPLAFALLLALRVLAIACDVTPSSDADWYFARAAMLADGRGYLANNGLPTAYWPPGWPMALSLAFRLFGPGTLAVGLFNLACAALSGWLLLDLGRRLFGSEAGARLALFAYAVYPNAVLYVPLALTEVFYTAMLLAGCWLLVARTGPGATALAGLVFGMATLVKAQTLVVVPLVFAIALWREPDALRRLPGVAARAVLLLAAAAAVVAPWTLRNHRELGAWVAVSTNGGITLLTGNNDSAQGGFTPEDPVVRALDARTDLDELGYDAEARRLGMAWIRANPDRFAALAPRKLVRLWGPDGEGVWAYETGSPAWRAAPWAFTALRLVNQAWYVALLALFAAAFLVQARRRLAEQGRRVDWWLLPYGIALYPSAIAVLFSGQSRFHFPAMPFVCMAAGWLVADWLARRAARR